LSSIAEQTIAKHIEWIVCDDCSTDRTAEIVSVFAARVTFTVVWKRNEQQLGVLQNFLLAFEICRGRYIAYCDHDDVWRSDKLELCLRAFEEGKDTALVSHLGVLTNNYLTPSGVVLPEVSKGVKGVRPYFPSTYWGFGHQMVFSSGVVKLMRFLIDQKPFGLEIYYRNLGRLIPLSAGILGGVKMIDQGLTYFRYHPGSVFPAGKKEFSRVRLLPRRMQRVCYLNESRHTMNALKQFVEYERNSGMGVIPAQWSDEYAAYLNQLLHHLELRLMPFHSVAALRRLKSLFKAMAGGAYLSERKHEFGLKQFLLDLYAMLSTSKLF